jgi:hypothetical protein
MAARNNRQQPSGRGVPRRRVPGGSRLRSRDVENVTDASSEREQEDEEIETEKTEKE